jgi:hypothetical protein
MAGIKTNFASGTTTDNPLLIGATTANSAAFASLPSVTSPQYLWLTLDPTGSAGAPEIVKVTAHTAAATSVTIARAQQSTTARQHAVTTSWVASLTKSDADLIPQAGTDTSPPTTEGQLYAKTSDNRLYVGDGGASQRIGHWASDGRTGGLWTVTSQALAGLGAVDISWDAETTDSDGFLTTPGTTLTVPAGLGGIYVAQAQLTWSGTPGIVSITMGSYSAGVPALDAGVASFASATFPVAAAETIKLTVLASAQNLSGTLFVHRIGL